MAIRSLHFDNSREAQDVSGRIADCVPGLEEQFGVRITARGATVELEGSEADVERVERFFHNLRKARNRGVQLHRHEIQYAARAFQSGRESELVGLTEARIDVSPGKDPVFPRTFGQQRYVRAIRENDLTFGIGPAGTGKTYLAMAAAVSALQRDDVSRIILTRPAIEAGEALGFLPGDIQAKVLPYLRPLYDALYDMMNPEETERHMERGTIEVAPLAYMRGRTLNHAFIILDEAQNTTEEQMLMFLTRLGFDSKCVVTGDLTQVDLPGSKASGLREARRTLREIDGIAVVELDDSDVVRHELVQKIIQAYRHGRGESSRGEESAT